MELIGRSMILAQEIEAIGNDIKNLRLESRVDPRNGNGVRMCKVR